MDSDKDRAQCKHAEWRAQGKTSSQEAPLFPAAKRELSLIAGTEQFCTDRIDFISEGMPMRCLNCHTVCDPSDAICLTCRKPIVVARRGGGLKAGSVTKWALIFMIIGQCVFNVVLAPRWFPRPTDGGINMQQCLWAAIVGAGCALLGAVVGMFGESPLEK
jgi:hypothetical protein